MRSGARTINAVRGGNLEQARAADGGVRASVIVVGPHAPMGRLKVVGPSPAVIVGRQRRRLSPIKALPFVFCHRPRTRIG